MYITHTQVPEEPVDGNPGLLITAVLQEAPKRKQLSGEKIKTQPLSMVLF